MTTTEIIPGIPAEPQPQTAAIVARDNKFVPAETRRTALPAVRGLLPTRAEYEVYLELAENFIESGFLPTSITKPAQALAIMLTGRELGLAPMLALRSLHVIEGKPGMSAELILARFRQAGGKYRWVEKTDQCATIQAVAPGNPIEWVETFSFSIEEAERAGVTDKKNWKRYPAAMLRARAASLMVRAIAPEVSAGLYDPDELGAETTESGEVVWPEPEPARNWGAQRSVSSDPKPRPTSSGAVEDPVLPIKEMLAGNIPLSSPECRLGHVLKFIALATKTPAATKQYTSLIQRAYAVIPLKLQDASFDHLTKVCGWLTGDAELSKLFKKELDSIEHRMEKLNEMAEELNPPSVVGVVVTVAPEEPPIIQTTSDEYVSDAEITEATNDRDREADLIAELEDAVGGDER